MQSPFLEPGNQPSLKLVTQRAESLLRKAEILNQIESPVINITEAQKIKETARIMCTMPPQQQAYIKLNKYDFF